jgi:hypothetical protein
VKKAPLRAALQGIERIELKRSLPKRAVNSLRHRLPPQIPVIASRSFRQRIAPRLPRREEC